MQRFAVCNLKGTKNKEKWRQARNFSDKRFLWYCLKCRKRTGPICLNFKLVIDLSCIGKKRTGNGPVITMKREQLEIPFHKQFSLDHCQNRRMYLIGLCRGMLLVCSPELLLGGKEKKKVWRSFQLIFLLCSVLESIIQNSFHIWAAALLEGSNWHDQTSWRQDLHQNWEKTGISVAERREFLNDKKYNMWKSFARRI